MNNKCYFTKIGSVQFNNELCCCFRTNEHKNYKLKKIPFIRKAGDMLNLLVMTGKSNMYLGMTK